MGCYLISSDGNYSPPNPNPSKFKILEILGFGKYLVLTIKYYGCNQYNGNKVLIVNNSVDEIINRKEIDPHFIEKSNLKTIARFVPTEKKLAVAFARMLYKGDCI